MNGSNKVDLLEVPMSKTRVIGIQNVDDFQWKYLSCLPGWQNHLSIYVEDHIKQVDEIVTTLADAGVTFKITQCHFIQRIGECLGPTISPGQLEVDTTNV